MRFSVLLICAAFVLLSSCLPKSDAPVGTFIRKNLVYGPYTRNRMDVYLPHNRDTTTRTVFLIHGGGWIAGDKGDWNSTAINTLLNAGYGVVCMNYRYADGDFHHQMGDIKTALDYFDGNAGDWNVAKRKFALMGASAGGHLSLLFGHAFDSLHRVKAVISFVGPTDMTDTVFHQYANNYSIGYVFQQFLGATYQANPQVYRDASPLYNSSNVPTLFMHGSQDNLVPPYQGTLMFDTLTAHNVPTDTTYFGNAGHDLFGPGSVNSTQIYSEVKQWLNLYLH